MSFPEEPLNLSPKANGPGYFTGTIHQEIGNGKYKIIRKLGYGPCSSTWLVVRKSDKGYSAVQIFTVASSDRVSKVVPVLEAVNKLASQFPLPWMRDHFRETSDHGSHICIVIPPVCPSIEDLRLEETSQRLPVHVVQRVVYCTLEALTGLHSAKIMHGAIRAENVYFITSTDTDRLKSELESEPAPVCTEVNGFTTVKSQPLTQFQLPWRHKKASVSEWALRLGGLGHAQQPAFKPELDQSYSSAPETLLHKATCSPQTDIWMLGCMTFHLLTAKDPPFMLEDTPSKCLAAAQTFIDDQEIPTAWLNDPVAKNISAGVKDADTTATKTLEACLFESLSKTEASAAAKFIKGCLRLDPGKRTKAKEYIRLDWLSTANACGCGYC